MHKTTHSARRAHDEIFQALSVVFFFWQKAGEEPENEANRKVQSFDALQLGDFTTYPKAYKHPKNQIASTLRKFFSGLYLDSFKCATLHVTCGDINLCTSRSSERVKSNYQADTHKVLTGAHNEEASGRKGGA